MARKKSFGYIKLPSTKNNHFGAAPHEPPPSINPPTRPNIRVLEGGGEVNRGNTVMTRFFFLLERKRKYDVILSWWCICILSGEALS